LADKIGARAILIGGPAGAALAYVWMALGQEEALMLGMIVPMTLLGLSFAVLMAPLTASVMSSVDQTDEGLGSGGCDVSGTADGLSPAVAMREPPRRQSLPQTEHLLAAQRQMANPFHHSISVIAKQSRAFPCEGVSQRGLQRPQRSLLRSARRPEGGGAAENR
jgi:hypothetical protein